MKEDKWMQKIKEAIEEKEKDEPKETKKWRIHEKSGWKEKRKKEGTMSCV